MTVEVREPAATSEVASRWDSLAGRRLNLRLQFTTKSPGDESRALALTARDFAKSSLLHAFEYRGLRLLLDPVTGLALKCDPETLRIVGAIECRAPENALAGLFEHVGIERSRRVLDELARMASTAGMFQRDSLDDRARQEEAVAAVLSHRPRKLTLVVAQTCNLRCRYCYAVGANFADEGRRMPLDVAQQAIRFLCARSGRRRHLTVTLFGGEPLTNFPVIEAVVPWAHEECRKHRKTIHFCISTNGTLLSDQVIDFLIREKLSILVSLDGPKDIHDAFRPMADGRGSFEVLAPKLTKLLQRHPHPETIAVRATMTHANHDVEALVRFFESFGFQTLMIGSSLGFAFSKGPLDLTQSDIDELYVTTERALDEYALDAIRRYERARYNPVLKSILAIHREDRLMGAKAKIQCGVGRNDQAVDVDGNVYPCHRYVGVSTYSIGSVYTGIDETRISRYYRQLLSACPRCKSCWATRWCGGGCPRYVSMPSGDICAPDRAYCDNARRWIERNIALHEMLTEDGVQWDRFPDED